MAENVPLRLSFDCEQEKDTFRSLRDDTIGSVLLGVGFRDLQAESADHFLNFPRGVVSYVERELLWREGLDLLVRRRQDDLTAWG